MGAFSRVFFANTGHIDSELLAWAATFNSTVSYIWVSQINLTTLTFDFYFQLWLYVSRYCDDL